MQNKKIAYLVANLEIPFWQIMKKGIKTNCNKLGYDLEVLDAQDNQKKELENTVKAIKDKVDGIVLSSINSYTAGTILKLTKKANIPVVISDTGTRSKDYISYISSNNKLGAYDLGKYLTKELTKKGFEKGEIGIIALPQKKIITQERTAGFLKALDESPFKSADLKQVKTRTEEETYNLIKNMIIQYPDLHTIWLQSSKTYKSAIKAINDFKKQNEILLITFDLEPDFLELIPKNIILASAVQQPFIMGELALEQMDNYLKGKKVQKVIELPVNIITADNIKEKTAFINHNVLGIQSN
ncbi:substrate-binding domain-containing protein [Arcobacter nitrofigilis]|uniref:substrate-binding domain-containing protein n=1 Tax=Arcobacter nitrofigilis TaxID=28199 RepID=UPI0002F59806|nr:substrate-binding domain-containing protein [Arcobacter nitrofigilis]